MRDLARLARLDVALNFLYLGTCWALILLSVWLFAVERSWLTFALAFLVVSSRQQALLNVEHDCIHNHFVPGRRWNERVGIVMAASPCGSPFYASRARHLAHHRLLASAEDPDARLHTSDDKRTAGGVLRYFALGLVGGYAATVMFEPEAVAVEPSLRRRDRRNVLLAQAVLVVVFTLLFGWWAYPLLWLVPVYVFTYLADNFRAWVEHSHPEEDAAADRHRLITFLSSPVERMLFAPMNMNYHAVHHLWPSIPYYHLPAADREIRTQAQTLGLEWRGSYLSYLVRYWLALPIASCRRQA